MRGNVLYREGKYVRDGEVRKGRIGKEGRYVQEEMWYNERGKQG